MDDENDLDLLFLLLVPMAILTSLKGTMLPDVKLATDVDALGRTTDTSLDILLSYSTNLVHTGLAPPSSSHQPAPSLRAIPASTEVALRGKKLLGL